MANPPPEKEPFTVWNVPGINKIEFYAACIYLNTAQKQQAKAALMPGPQDRPETTQTTRDFLDCLADCFARSKEEDSPQHVTATAMVIDFRRKTIYIAKNRGEDYSKPGEEGKKDKDFAKSLQDWFNQLSGASRATAESVVQDEADLTHTEAGSIRGDAGNTGITTNLLEPSIESTSNEALSALGTSSPIHVTTGLNSMEDDRHRDAWENMLNFSDSRVTSYIKKVKKAKPNEIAHKQAWKGLSKVSEEQNSGFKEAWGVVDRCDDTDLSSCKSKSNCVEKAEACRQGSDFSSIRLIVRTKREQDAQEKNDYKQLSDLIKFIDLLGRLRYAFNVFQKYCRDSGGYWFTLQFLNSSVYSLPEGCSSKIDAWYELNPDHRNALPKEFKDNAMQNAKPDQEKKNQMYFHCELQLLKHFTETPSKGCQDYFGCSKRSCWLCWSVLTYIGKFHTKASHEKIYHRWAFPVVFSPEKEKQKLSTALRLTYQDLVKIIRQKIIAGNAFAEHDVRTETSGRAFETATVTSTPPSCIRRIELPDTDRPEVTEFRWVCFPANGRLGCEEVRVALYQRNLRDLWESTLPQLSIRMRSSDYLIPAFMLINKPSSQESFAGQSWHRECYLSAYNGEYGKGDLWLLFQSNPDAKPNLWISSLLAQQKPVGDWEKVIAQEDFLWRGAVYAVIKKNSARLTTELLQPELAFVTEVEEFLAGKLQAMTLDQYGRRLNALAIGRQIINSQLENIRQISEKGSETLTADT